MNQIIGKPSTQQLHQNSFMPQMAELNQLMHLCQVLSTTQFYQKLGAGGVLAIWLTARELNLPPMMCLNGGLYNIDGKVSMSSQLMNMMILNAGHKVDILYLNDKGCKIKFTRIYRDGRTKFDDYEFNEKDAQRAKYFGEPGTNGTWLKKPKDNWMMYPRDMYFARTLSGGAKKFLPEIMMNCYAHGELQDAQAEDITCSSEFIANLIPVSELNKNKEKEDNKPDIDSKKLESFKERYEIDKGSKYDIYLTKISERSKETKDEVIVCACMNEEGFIKYFNEWAQEIEEKEKNKESTEENLKNEISVDSEIV